MLIHKGEKMRIKEYYYYGKWQYESAGIEPFLEHVKEYLSGKRTVPVTKTSSISHESMFFTFSNDLYKMFLDSNKKLLKSYECALKYGFRGYSRGKKNGIFYIRKNDKGLITSVNNFIEQYKHEIIMDIDCSLEGLPILEKIKIVSHDPSGERIVGVLNNENSRAIFLGFGNY